MTPWASFELPDERYDSLKVEADAIFSQGGPIWTSVGLRALDAQDENLEIGIDSSRLQALRHLAGLLTTSSSSHRERSAVPSSDG